MTKRLSVSLVALVSLLAASTAGCAVNDTPQVSDFKLSTADVSRGTPITASATVEDDDQDLAGGKMVVTMKAGGQSANIEMDIAQVMGGGVLGAPKVALQFPFAVTPDAPTGPATLELVVVDKAGHSSDPVSVTMNVK
jgi:hypothetical protein